jgi:hypothetical protein
LSLETKQIDSRGDLAFRNLYRRHFVSPLSALKRIGKLQCFRAGLAQRLIIALLAQSVDSCDAAFRRLTKAKRTRIIRAILRLFAVIHADAVKCRDDHAPLPINSASGSATIP